MTEWRCKLCQFFTEKSSELVKHYVSLHVPQCRSVKLPCIFAQCVELSPTYAAWKQHRSRHHPSVCTVLGSEFYCCHISECYETLVSACKFMQHLRSDHLNFNQTVVCPFRGCDYESNIAQNFRKHQSRYHSRYNPTAAFKTCVLKNVRIPSESPDLPNLQPDEFFSDGTCDELNNINGSGTSNASECDVDNDTVRMLSSFLMQLQVLDCLSFETIQRIVEQINDLTSASLNAVKKTCEDELRKFSLNENIIASALKAFEKNPVEKACGFGAVLSTHKRRQSYFKSEIGHVEPINCQLDSLHSYSYCRNLKICTETFHLFLDIIKNFSKRIFWCKIGFKNIAIFSSIISKFLQYVPLLEDLELYLQKEDIAREAFVKKPEFDGIYREFSDGSIYRNHSLFSTEEHSIQLFFFSDAFQTGNPLGVRKKATKLDAVYFTVGNLPKKYRSSLQNIRLCLLVKSFTLKKFGYKTVFRRLIDDLLVLETCGIFVPYLQKNVKGTAAIVSADNLGGHALGGFNESFSGRTLRICRTCMATYDGIQFNHAETFLLRTKEDYDSQITDFEAGLTDSTTYGIKTRCCFNRLQFAHVIDLLPPDVMHDVCEGLISSTLSAALEYFIRRKYFTAELLNKKLKTFPFGRLDRRNISDFINPKFCNKTSGIGDNATKNMYLLRFFPFLIDGYIPHTDPVLELLTECWELVLRICAESFTEDSLYCLDALIKSFRQHFLEIFCSENSTPKLSFKPKFHFIEHYPNAIRRFGPLANCSTLRYEAKHFWFKKVAQKALNYKNITLTLSRKHQMLQTYCKIQNWLQVSR